MVAANMYKHCINKLVNIMCVVILKRFICISLGVLHIYSSPIKLLIYKVYLCMSVYHAMHVSIAICIQK